MYSLRAHTEKYTPTWWCNHMTSNHCYLYHPILYRGHEINPRNWADGAVPVFMCVHVRVCASARVCVYAYVRICIHLCMSVSVCLCLLRCLKWRSVQRQNCLLSFMPFAHMHKPLHTCTQHKHTHTPAFIKTSHSVNILCAVMLSAVNGNGCVFTVNCKSCRVLSCQSLMNC